MKDKFITRAETLNAAHNLKRTRRMNSICIHAKEFVLNEIFTKGGVENE